MIAPRTRRSITRGLTGLLAGCALLVGSCGDDHPTEVDVSGQILPDFTLLDVHCCGEECASCSTYVSLSDYANAGTAIMLVYMLDAQCQICKGNWGGMSTVVDSLHNEGITSLNGFAINVSTRATYAGTLPGWGSTWPVLQDTRTASESYDDVAHLLDSTNGHELLIAKLNQEGDYVLRKKTIAYTLEHGGLIDTRFAAGRAELASWIADLAAEE